MKVSLLVPTYKDTVALELILEALEKQTYKDFEVIVAEDDNSLDIKAIKKRFLSLDIKHVYHENKGNRKAIIMNRALEKVGGDYIIFIDGDTIPFSTFVESHVDLAEPKTVLCGRRVNLGDNISKILRESNIKSYFLEKNYLRNFFYLKKDRTRHYEQGLYLKANGIVNQFLSKLNNNIHILASNFSCFKKDIFEVNGFNEDLPYAPNRDDTDLEWRMIGMGCKMKSAKYCANMFHLNHTRNDRRSEEDENMKIIRVNQKNKIYTVKNGIFKL